MPPYVPSGGYMPPYVPSGGYMPPWVCNRGVLASLGVKQGVLASPSPVSLLGSSQPPPYHPFHCWAVLSLSLLFPFHCWTVLRHLLFLSRFTVGQFSGLLSLPVSLLVSSLTSCGLSFPFHCWARKEDRREGYPPPCIPPTHHRQLVAQGYLRV